MSKLMINGDTVRKLAINGDTVQRVVVNGDLINLSEPITKGWGATRHYPQVYDDIITFDVEGRTALSYTVRTGYSSVTMTVQGGESVTVSGTDTESFSGSLAFPSGDTVSVVIHVYFGSTADFTSSGTLTLA